MKLNRWNYTEKNRSKIAIGLVLLLISLIWIIVFHIEASAAFFFVFIPQLFFLFIGLNSGLITVALFSIILFITQGINSILFYIIQNKYASEGYLAVGSFSFGLFEYINYYKYVFIFELLVVFITILLCNKCSWSLKSYYSRVYYIISSNGKRRDNSYKVVILCLLFSFMSIWMFNLHIGITGIVNQIVLPFHLTGLFYYIRELIPPIVLSLLYFTSSRRKICLCSIIIYSFVLGTTSLSRGFVGLVLIPIAIIDLIDGRILSSAIVYLVYTFIHFTINSGRGIVYANPVVNINYYQLFKFILTELISSDSSSFSILYLIDELSTRLYGCQSVVIGLQCRDLNISDLISYYLGNSDVLSGSILKLFSITIPEGMGFGVSIGFIGNMLALSNESFLIIVLQAFIVILYFSILEYCIYTSRLYSKDKGMIVMLCLVFIWFLVFWLGRSNFTLLFLCFAFLLSKAQKHFSFKAVSFHY